jgi:hypothetical protein
MFSITKWSNLAKESAELSEAELGVKPSLDLGRK